MNKLAVLILLLIFTLYGLNKLNTHTDIFKNVNWDVLLGLLILWGIPAIPTILAIIGIIWFIRFLFKVEKKLDE